MTDRAYDFRLPDERQALILARLQRDGRVLASDLAREHETSEDTIRRDLRDLAAAGHCRRVYGGALPVSPASGPLDQRRRERPEAKHALGRAAAGLVHDRQTVMIDAGSTNLCIAQALAEDARLTVVTNSPAIAAALEPKAGVEVILLGGRYDRRSGGTLGARTLREAMHLRPDLYFVGACAVDPGAGLSVFDPEEAELKRALADAAGLLAAAVTDEKLGTAAPHRIAAWADLDHLVVESVRSVPAEAGPGPRFHVAFPSKVVS